MKPIRRLVRLSALVMVASLAACSGDNSLTGVDSAPATEQGLIGSLLGPTGLLSCSPLPVTSASATIGPLGGQFLIGPHTLRVPAGALDHSVTITGTTLAGNRRAITFAPHGLEFERSAYLTMSYDGCSTLGLLLPKRIAYTNDVFAILEFLLSVDNLLTQRVTGRVDHFSNYAVAW